MSLLGGKSFLYPLMFEGGGGGGCDLADNRQISRRKCKVIYICMQGLLVEYPELKVYIPI